MVGPLVSGSSTSCRSRSTRDSSNHEMSVTCSPKTQPVDARVRSPVEGSDDEAEQIYGRADHWDSAGAGIRRIGGGPVPEARHEQRQLVWLEGAVRGQGRVRCPAGEKPDGRE